MTGADTPLEPIDAFRARARTWIDAHLPHREGPAVASRALQQLLFDHGFAGIAFPAAYGGAGLTLEHQKAFFDAVDELRRQVPSAYTVSVGMIGPTILEHASHQAKLRFLPPLLRGDEVWVQLLSEPRGGSDMAGAITRLVRDGATYVLNGAKMWSTGAAEADYGLCLCRSDWDVPKHRGLSMIAVPLTGTPGLSVERIRAASGVPGDFCQEFFDDVVLPAENLIGEECAGWAVAQEMSAHDRIFVVTHVDIVPTDAAAGTKLVQQYVADSRKDKGLVRIEAGAQISRTNHITLIEVWQNQKALDEHIAAAHTREFRQKIDPTLGSPYDERLHLNLE